MRVDSLIYLIILALSSSNTIPQTLTVISISWIYIVAETGIENVAAKIPIFQKHGFVCLLVLAFAFQLYELLARSEISAYVYNIPLVMQEVMPTVDHHSTTPAMLRVTTTVQNQSSM